MKKNKVISIADRSAIKNHDAEARRLLSGFRQLSRMEKETLLILLDAFLSSKSPTGRAGKKMVDRTSPGFADSYFSSEEAISKS